MPEQNTPLQPSATRWKPKHNQWAIALTVTLATFMEVLDTSIANVSLPHIAGSLAASQDEATWVLTSYLVSNAIVLPTSAYFASILGRKKFYMLCVMLFGISSFLCGIAPSLPLLLFFRVLQGIGGGGLAPSEQSILADTFEPAKRGQAFALYGLAVVTAPAIGPTLGGWITDNFDWRWIFFINIPVAIVSLFLTNRLVEDPPHVVEEVKRSKRSGFSMDYIGFALVGLGFGCLEVVLDKGQEDDWFGSRFVTTFFVLCIVGLVGLVLWEFRQIRHNHRPILDLRLFKNRTFAISFVMMFIVGLALYGTTVLIPQLLQTLMGYTAEKAGMALSFGGLATMFCMPFVGRMIGKVDARYMAAFGFLVMALALFHMTQLNLQMSFSYAAKLRVYQAIGLAFLFVPINTLSYTGIPMNKNNDVSGMVNLARNVGGSAGTAIFTTLLARHSQLHQNFLAEHVAEVNPIYGNMRSGLVQQFASRGSEATQAGSQAMAQIYRLVQQQAAVLAYLDVIQFFAITALCMVPLVFLMKKSKRGAAMAH
jgi:MFS transporter, DHA2 family, multidrug resistance protein